MGKRPVGLQGFAAGADTSHADILVFRIATSDPNGAIPSNAAADCIEGLSSLVRLSAGLAIGSPMATKSLDDEGLQIRVLPARHGSHDIVIIVNTILVNIIASRLDRLIDIGVLGHVAGSLFKRFVVAKRHRRTVIGTSFDLAEFMTERANGLLDVRVDPEVADRVQVEFAEALDHAANSIVEPVLEKGGAKLIQPRFDRVAATISLADKRVVQSPFEIEERTDRIGAPFVATVRFDRVNWKTGNGLLHFDEPREVDGISLDGTLRCTITDPRLKKPNDPYSAAFAAKSPLPVVVQRVAEWLNDKVSYRWLVLGLPEAETGFLF